MSKYQIYDQPIEVKSKSSSGLFSRKYPFSELLLGQSFFVPPEDQPSIKAIRSSCSTWGKRLNRKFVAVEVNGWIQVGRVKTVEEEKIEQWGNHVGTQEPNGSPWNNGG